LVIYHARYMHCICHHNVQYTSAQITPTSVLPLVDDKCWQNGDITTITFPNLAHNHGLVNALTIINIKQGFFTTINSTTLIKADEDGRVNR
jgi:hypothetical protein